MENPITIKNIVNHQAADLPLQRKIITNSDLFQHKELEGYEVIHTQTNSDPTWKIAVPNSLLANLLTWYHLVLGHCRQQRLYNTVRMRFHSPNLQKDCVDMVNRCPQKCQMNKQTNRNYGHFLPPRIAGFFPWETVAVDLIGPWKIKINNI